MAGLLAGIVILASGALFIWRSQAMRRTPSSSPILMKQAKQNRDAGVVIFVAGVVVVLLSAIALATGRI